MKRLQLYLGVLVVYTVAFGLFMFYVPQPTQNEYSCTGTSTTSLSCTQTYTAHAPDSTQTKYEWWISGTVGATLGFIGLVELSERWLS